jgi:hypothetical protein
MMPIYHDQKYVESVLFQVPPGCEEVEKGIFRLSE